MQRRRCSCNNLYNLYLKKYIPIAKYNLLYIYTVCFPGIISNSMAIQFVLGYIGMIIDYLNNLKQIHNVVIMETRLQGQLEKHTQFT